MHSAPPSSHAETLEDQVRSIHQEARMVLPGVQALFGFQLVAVFDRRFTHLGQRDQEIHFASLLLVAIAIALLMAPAAYHRLSERTLATSFFVRMSSQLIAAAMVVLAAAIAVDVYIVGRMIRDDVLISIAWAVVVLVALLLLWIGFPLWHTRRKRRAKPGAN